MLLSGCIAQLYKDCNCVAAACPGEAPDKSTIDLFNKYLSYIHINAPDSLGLESIPFPRDGITWVDLLGYIAELKVSTHDRL